MKKAVFSRHFAAASIVGCILGAASSAALPLQTSITKDSVTWTFSGAVPVGQFVNGDYYVVGPVTVTAITPVPQTTAPYANGAVLNLPTPDGKSAFDQRLNDGSDESWWFNAGERVYPPLSLKPGDALVSSISLSSAQYHNVPEVMRSGDQSISPVAGVSVLTVLPAAVSADAFRPSYCDRTQRIYHADSLKRQLLASVAPPNPAATPSLTQFETWFRRPWLDMNPFLFDAPAQYMPSYGAYVGFAVSYAGLLLSLNFTTAQKTNLTNYLVQYGIDLFGSLKAGYGWPAFGGHRSGRKMPIVLAGILLQCDSMKNVSTYFPDQFGEDMQTLYIKTLAPAGSYAKAWQGATVIYGGHYGVHADGTPVSAGLYGPYEQLQPRDWPLLNPSEQLGEAYRRCCTSMCWIGEALTMHLMGAETVWDHPAFFDYAIRWMCENDSAAIDTIKAQSAFDYSASWDRQQQTAGIMQGEFPQYTFIDDMWRAYHPCGSSMGINNGTIRSIPSNPALVVFSNPFNSMVTIGLPNFLSPVDVKICTLTGAMVASFHNVREGKVVWNAGKHSNGLYVIEAEAGERMATRQLQLLR